MLKLVSKDFVYGTLVSLTIGTPKTINFPFGTKHFKGRFIVTPTLVGCSIGIQFKISYTVCLLSFFNI